MNKIKEIEIDDITMHDDKGQIHLAPPFRNPVTSKYDHGCKVFNIGNMLIEDRVYLKIKSLYVYLFRTEIDNFILIDRWNLYMGTIQETEEILLEILVQSRSVIGE